jgi:NADPH:quinone reductase-like Zn-dependent oxidoreductase
MKAVFFNEYGSPDNLHLKEVAKPIPDDDEVLIKVQASSINSWDWEFLSGTPFINRLMFGLFKPKAGKQILGADVAGTVEVVGARVKKFHVGDRVFGDLWDQWGGFAEFACAKETDLELMPKNSSFEEAAAVPQAGVLALQGFLKAEKLEPGAKVLINGAGGGVGTFAIQLAKLSGAEVTGVDARHKLDIVRSVGADHVVDYQQVDYTNTGEQYDLIIDCQSDRSISDYKRALRPHGTYAMIGGSSVLPKMLQSVCSRFTGETRKFFVVMDGPNKGLDYLRELIENRRIAPVIDKTFQLCDVPKAMRYFEQGLHKGKIVISMENKRTQE